MYLFNYTKDECIGMGVVMKKIVEGNTAGLRLRNFITWEAAIAQPTDIFPIRDCLEKLRVTETCPANLFNLSLKALEYRNYLDYLVSIVSI